MTDDRLDDLLARHLGGKASADDVAAARVLAVLSGPLPRQNTGRWRNWPGILLDWQFAPAWPRLAALACCAVLGFAAGIAGLDQRLGGPGAPFAVATDLSTLVFEPEPLTGLRP